MSVYLRKKTFPEIFPKWYILNKKVRFNRTYFMLVGMTGFEPAASSSQMKRDTKLRYIPILPQLDRVIGAPDTDRTCNPQIRSLVLYPIELQAHLA